MFAAEERFRSTFIPPTESLTQSPVENLRDGTEFSTVAPPIQFRCCLEHGLDLIAPTLANTSLFGSYSPKLSARVNAE
jgi:hypothetical protein